MHALGGFHVRFIYHYLPACNQPDETSPGSRCPPVAHCRHVGHWGYVRNGITLPDGNDHAQKPKRKAPTNRGGRWLTSFLTGLNETERTAILIVDLSAHTLEMASSLHVNFEAARQLAILFSTWALQRAKA